jgi:predicted phosphodiesterase
MKIFLLSDLHLEGSNYKFPFPEADVCILAGDICVASRMNQDHIRNFFQRVSTSFERSYYVPGNHEYYHSLYGPRHDSDYTEKHLNSFVGDRIIKRHLEEWGIDNIIFMNCGTDIHNGVKFIGGTLWTDYFGNNPLEKLKAIQCMADFSLISGFTPDRAYEEHMLTRAHIKEEIGRPFDGPKVIITHHGPTLKSIHPRYRLSPEDYLNASFTSDCSELFHDIESPAELWVHGHTHEALNYMYGNTRVVVNPRGYRGEIQADPFNPNLVVEI